MIRAAFVAMLALAIALPAAVAEETGFEQKLDDYLRPYIDVGHLSGTLLVSRNDDVIYEKSFGLADREHDVANTPATVFGIGSVNKPMTIVILAQLIDQGSISLDDTVSAYLPDFPRGDELTVNHLLEHSAGIPHRVTSELDETKPQTAASMTALAANAELIFEPGSDSVYSSAGFSVLARVLEIASDKSYPELLETYVIQPASMVATSDAGSRPILKRRAKAYYFDTHDFVNAPPGDISYLVGAGSVFSTPRDLLAMQRALLQGKYGDTAKDFLVRENGGLSWNGSAAGYRTFVDFDASSGITVILSANVTSGANDRVRQSVLPIALGEEVPVPGRIRARAVDVANEVLLSYEGSYQLRPGRNLELRIVDGRVIVDDWLLIPVTQTTLFSPQDYAEIEVIVDPRGNVTRLDWKIGDQVYPLPKVDVEPGE